MVSGLDSPHMGFLPEIAQPECDDNRISHNRPRKGASTMRQALGGRQGFTLTELMVVVAIIVLLTSIVVPNLAGRLTKARMEAAEDQIAEIEAALANYHADFGTYPGDVFPTEDMNNNGVLDWFDADGDGIVDPGEGEDEGVDVDRDGLKDYACDVNGDPVPNGRIDQGDGLVNIYDLEWALKTTAKNGPYMEEIPLDPWGNKYVYYAPFERPTNDQDFLYIDPGEVGDEIVSEDADEDGRLDDTEDTGIADYDTQNANVRGVVGANPAFTDMRAGEDNDVLDHGDDDNKDGVVNYYWTIQASPAPQQIQALELGNKDKSPDGLASRLGYYIYSIGRNKKDESATGYEDVGGLAGTGEPDGSLNTNAVSDMRLYVDTASRLDEDIDADDTLDTGYEDTGIDGLPGTKDRGEDDWDDPNTTNPTVTAGGPNEQPDEEFGTQTLGPTTWHYNEHHDPANPNTQGFDIGGDDINSWNRKRPWRENPSYGG